MSTKSEHLNRMAYILKKESERNEQVREIMQKYDRILKPYKDAEQRLMDALETEICDIIEKHKTWNCRTRYPDDYWFEDNGTVTARIDADHPNDIIDMNFEIEELLKAELL